MVHYNPQTTKYMRYFMSVSYNRRTFTMIASRDRKPVFWALLLVLILGITLPQLALSQGESAVPFLMLAPNARADAMGEAGAALADDASASFWNPAGLAFQNGQEVSITHSNLLPQFQQTDLFYD